tara:strand:+ start:238 stop:1008 length:771 start_codon:yes stop_codon:yes gene_type:complete
MLRSRIIPCLLIKKNALVKTKNFNNPVYVGDPLNTVRIFNEKEVDEIIILNIDNKVTDYLPNYELISKLANECRMPVCYGGGINSVDQIEKIISLGIEKVSLNTAAIYKKNLIREASKKVGSQSIVVSIDIKKNNFDKKYYAFTHNGSSIINNSIKNIIRDFEEEGAGEILINSIDRDGTKLGYDIELYDKIRPLTSLPITLIGGAGNINDIKDLINYTSLVGAAAGSIFVFKGKFNAVLINYPSKIDKKKLFLKV